MRARWPRARTTWPPWSNSSASAWPFATALAAMPGVTVPKPEAFYLFPRIGVTDSFDFALRLLPGRRESPSAGRGLRAGRRRAIRICCAGHGRAGAGVGSAGAFLSRGLASSVGNRR
ncbi:MAG: hypothetical protein R2838_14205 [Caldilineaceae bacterium]